MKTLFTLSFMALVSGIFAQEKLPQRRQNLTPEQRTELQIKKMTLDLELTEKQQKEMTAMLLEQHKKMDARREELRLKKQAADKEKEEERFNKQIDALDEEIALREKVKKVLSAEQYSKWQAQRDQRKDILKSQAMKNREGRKHQKEQK
jgi:protein CpxP